MESKEEIIKMWNSIEAVCFDVDSTLCEDESIDELANYLGMGEKIAKLTQSAMSGDMKFEEALSIRLNAMRPSVENIQQFLLLNPPKLTKGVKELISKLHDKKTNVFLVSGGFRCIIHPIAELLNIPLDYIYANTILHNENGEYIGFDSNEFTSHSKGKAEALLYIKKKYIIKKIAMIGDGATDLETRTEGISDLFIGFGGIIERSLIIDKADWYITDFQILIDALY